MQILSNASLAEHSTMRLGGNAANLVEVSNQQELIEAVNWAESQNKQLIVIGSGSNIVWKDEGFSGLVIVNKIKGIEMINETDQDLYVTVGAGEIWDSVVERVVEQGYSGIEELSLIPGTAGGAPVQNIGAYGREISSVLSSVQAYDRTTKQVVNIPSYDCQFAYRTSRFKTTDRGRFCILSITLHVTKTNPQPPFYSAVEEYFSRLGITTYTPQALRDAVIFIRTNKMPDPAMIPNNGSFFTNPIIDQDKYEQLKDKYSMVVSWPAGEGKVKLSAGWLVEQAGFRGFHDQETGMATWERQSIVFVNEHAKTTADLLKFRDRIIKAVQDKFGVTLTQEPELI